MILLGMCLLDKLFPVPYRDVLLHTGNTETSIYLKENPGSLFSMSDD